jgi:hypothetical protein
VQEVMPDGEGVDLRSGRRFAVETLGSKNQYRALPATSAHGLFTSPLYCSLPPSPAKQAARCPPPVPEVRTPSTSVTPEGNASPASRAQSANDPGDASNSGAAPASETPSSSPN